MKKIYFVGIFIYIISHGIYASEQYPDLIIYNGKEFEIGVYPMETYYNIYPNKRPGTIGRNSTLLRGYRAKYEIINSELILIDIEVMRMNGSWNSVFNRYFKKKIKVDSYTGKINLFNGEITGVYMAFTPIYEKYLILEIRNGNCIAENEINCFEYLQSLIQSSLDGSYEQNYFINLLEKLNNRN
jgi:hypothetical protein